MLPGPWGGLGLGPPAALTGPSTGGRMPPLAGAWKRLTAGGASSMPEVRQGAQDKPASPRTARGGAMPLGHAERATVGRASEAELLLPLTATAAKNLVR